MNQRDFQPGFRAAIAAAFLAAWIAGRAGAEDFQSAGAVPPQVWRKTAVLPSSEAYQAAAASERFAFAIGNRRIVKYDRASGRRVSESRGKPEHLNSGFLWQGKLYCAHSNYPHTPEHSQVKALDLESMELSTFKDFGVSEGSLTWIVRHDGSWWCTFAYYGEQNSRTYLVRFNDPWQEQGRWRYPAEVVARLGRASISGGLWRQGAILATGHDAKELYRLRLPHDGSVLEYVETVPAPFTGQGIAHDPATGGLVGIDRKQRQIVFATLTPR